MIIRKKFRKEYLEAMREADESDLWKLNEGLYSDLIIYCASEFIESYWNLFL